MYNYQADVYRCVSLLLCPYDVTLGGALQFIRMRIASWRL